MADVKIKSADFCAQEGIKKYQLYHLFKVHKGLKAKVAGEKGCRVNLTRWERIKATA